MYQVWICDDEEKILDRLKEKITKEFNQLEIQAEYTLIKDARVLMNQLKSCTVDILFLDIDMPYFTGMEIADYIKENQIPLILVFVTSHDTLVYKSFAYRPFAFLRKTCIDEDIEEFSTRIKAELEERKKELILSKGAEIYKINISDLVYMESEGNYINVVTIDKEYRFRETMASMEEQLMGKNFIRCHKGYLVNAHYITKFHTTSLEIKGAINQVKDIPVGRSYEKEVKRKIIESMR